MTGRVAQQSRPTSSCLRRSLWKAACIRASWDALSSPHWFSSTISLPASPSSSWMACHFLHPELRNQGRFMLQSGCACHLRPTVCDWWRGAERPHGMPSCMLPLHEGRTVPTKRAVNRGHSHGLMQAFAGWRLAICRSGPLPGLTQQASALREVLQVIAAPPACAVQMSGTTLAQEPEPSAACRQPDMGSHQGARQSRVDRWCRVHSARPGWVSCACKHIYWARQAHSTAVSCVQAKGP